MLVSELLRSVMVECAELARAGRTPAPFHGCAHGAGGGPAIGVMQPPLALESRPRGVAAPAFLGPVIVYDRDTTSDAAAPLPQPTREPWPQAKPRHQAPHQAPMRRVA